MPLNRVFVEPMTGIEPAYSAWEAIFTLERVNENARYMPRLANRNCDASCNLGTASA